jgi:hypothetical protein
LIKHSIAADISEQYCSEDENILLLRARIKGIDLVLISIYGPNSNCPQFFIELGNLLQRYDGLPIICGGDWNCTFSTGNVNPNIDCINMARIPNLARRTVGN